jgi:hypothetical protein
VGELMARASAPTLLSLDRWARIMGISPVHFAGAAGSTFWRIKGACDAVWTQHAWQSVHLVSREEVAATIRDVEAEIASYLHWDVAPTWHVDDTYAWPRAFDPSYFGLHGDSVGGMPKLHLHRRKLLAPGVRAVAEVETAAAIVYSDDNADNFNETATLTVSTTVTDPRRIHLFFPGHDGDAEWEIRPLRSVTISAGTAVIVADSWLFVQPDLWETIPTGDPPVALDIEDTASFLEEADVYEVYNNDTAISSTMLWAAGSACSDADPFARTQQTGFLRIVDSDAGYAAFYPASYADAMWTTTPLTSYDRPEEVRFSYYAGALDDRYRSSKSLDPLSDYWAEAIAVMTAARLPNPVCNCDNVTRRIEKLQTDLLLSNKSSGFRAFSDDSPVKRNPFGWRYGEVQAWNRVSKEAGHA